MLSSTGESGRNCPDLDLSRKGSSLCPSSIMLAVGFLYIALIVVVECSFYVYLA